jgi:sugar/nucleoside kinase (ribokinase family)
LIKDPKMEKRELKEVKGNDLDVIGIGNLNMDFLIQLQRFPKKDEKLLIDNLTISPGGSACNFAVACSKLGLKTGFIGHVGKDQFGKEIIENLKRNKIDCSQIKIEERLSSGISLAFTIKQRKHFVLSYREANQLLKSGDLKLDYLKRVKLIHGASIVPLLAQKMAKIATKLQIKSSLDVGADFLNLKGKDFLDIVKRFSICFINQASYQKIFGKVPIEENILSDFPEGLEVLVVSKGSEGAIASDGRNFFSLPAYNVKVKSTTGAGDAFSAGFISSWLRAKNIREALKIGIAVASLKVQKVGGQEGLPNFKEVKKFLKSQEDAI